MRRDVVVLPLVPVMTMAPYFRSLDSLRRTCGSMNRATSPGSVVPPPRRVILEMAAVALPAHTAVQSAALEYLPLSADVTGFWGPTGFG